MSKPGQGTVPTDSAAGPPPGGKAKRGKVDKDAQKKADDEAMEAEWQRVLEYYEPENVEKREMEAVRKELEKQRKRTAADEEKEQVLESYYGIKPRKRPDLDPGDEDLTESTEVTEREDWNFPEDKEAWAEKDLGEEWADAPEDAPAPFYDPNLGVGLSADDEDDDDDDSPRRRKGSKKGAPKALPHSADRFVPYRRGVPPLPGWLDVDEHEEPLQVLEEMEMEEEYLQWASYVFRDGSSYEGTVWNDLAQGRGVYTTPSELCKYEGEWVQNRMEGWGVLNVDVPVRAPPPGSEAWKKLKEEGKLGLEGQMSEFDQEWLKMQIEDLTQQAEAAKKDDEVEDPTDEVPFEDDPAWVKLFGRLPERGHYQYAGQMKQNKFHGCGVFKLNGRMHAGKFNFGEFQIDPEECDPHMAGYHASLAEVTAAKARMFVNKPDGMVRELKGPFTDPSHPYMYDEADMWQAPGFVNEFYKVPKLWSKYVEEVDGEQQAWLNSFYKAPLRLPMPSELSYIWDKPEEFVLIRNEGPKIDGPVSEQEALMALPELQGECLLHVPSRQIINWASDPEGKLRFFIQPLNKDGSVDPSQVKVLPLGFDDFLGGKEPLGGGLEGEGEGEEEEEEEAVVGEDPKRANERRKRREAARRKREAAEAKRVREESFRRAEEEVEEAIKAELEEAEALRQLAEAEWQQEGALMEEVFEAKLDAAEEADVAPAGKEKKEKAPKAKAKEEVVEEEKEEEEEVEVEEEEEEEKEEEEEAEEEMEEEKEEEEEEEKEEEEEEEAEEEEEDEEEEERRRKPRSFGPASSSKPGSKPYASISLSSRVAFAHVAEATGGLLARLFPGLTHRAALSAPSEEKQPVKVLPARVAIKPMASARAARLQQGASMPRQAVVSRRDARQGPRRAQSPHIELDELTQILSLSFAV